MVDHQIKCNQSFQVAGTNGNREDVLPAGVGQGSDEDDWETTFLPPLQGALAILILYEVPLQSYYFTRCPCNLTALQGALVSSLIYRVPFEF